MFQICGKREKPNQEHPVVTQTASNQESQVTIETQATNNQETNVYDYCCYPHTGYGLSEFLSSLRVVCTYFFRTAELVDNVVIETVVPNFLQPEAEAVNREPMEALESVSLHATTNIISAEEESEDLLQEIVGDDQNSESFSELDGFNSLENSPREETITPVNLPYVADSTVNFDFSNYRGNPIKPLPIRYGDFSSSTTLTTSDSDFEEEQWDFPTVSYGAARVQLVGLVASAMTAFVAYKASEHTKE